MQHVGARVRPTGSWQLVGPLLPVGERGPIPDLRSYFNAVMRRFAPVARGGACRRGYGSWSTMYDRFRLWATTRVLQQVMDAMIAEAARRGQVGLSLVARTPPRPGHISKRPEWPR